MNVINKFNKSLNEVFIFILLKNNNNEIHLVGFSSQFLSFFLLLESNCRRVGHEECDIGHVSDCNVTKCNAMCFCHKTLARARDTSHVTQFRCSDPDKPQKAAHKAI